jgi:hypothetical protein
MKIYRKACLLCLDNIICHNAYNAIIKLLELGNIIISPYDTIVITASVGPNRTPNQFNLSILY